VAADYGVLLEDRGIALRGLSVIDPEGVLRYKRARIDVLKPALDRMTGFSG